MATMKYVKRGNAEIMKRPNAFKFDSDPKRSICKEYGMDESMFELRNKRTEDSYTVYDVILGNEAQKPHVAGKLYHRKPKWPGGPSNSI